MLYTRTPDVISSCDLCASDEGPECKNFAILDLSTLAHEWDFANYFYLVRRGLKQTFSVPKLKLLDEKIHQRPL